MGFLDNIKKMLQNKQDEVEQLSLGARVIVDKKIGEITQEMDEQVFIKFDKQASLEYSKNDWYDKNDNRIQIYTPERWREVKKAWEKEVFEPEQEELPNNIIIYNNEVFYIEIEDLDTTKIETSEKDLKQVSLIKKETNDYKPLMVTTKIIPEKDVNIAIEDYKDNIEKYVKEFEKILNYADKKSPYGTLEEAINNVSKNIKDQPSHIKKENEIER